MLRFLLLARRMTLRLLKQIPPNADATDASTMSLLHETLPPIRVLIADDSAMMRNELTRMLDSSPLMRVCGTARDGPEVLEKTKLLQPDVIALDVEMPLLNGVEALKRIMRECPCPVIMFSSSSRKGAEVTLEALSAGAFDYLPKIRPGLNALKLQEDLIEKVEAASHSWLARKRAPLHPPPIPSSALPVSAPVGPQLALQQTPRPVPRIIVLGTSTGGPQALQGAAARIAGRSAGRNDRGAAHASGFHRAPG